MPQTTLHEEMPETRQPTRLQQPALGRLVRLMNRPTQPGDMAPYDALRVLLLSSIEESPDD